MPTTHVCYRSTSEYGLHAKWDRRLIGTGEIRRCFRNVSFTWQKKHRRKFLLSHHQTPRPKEHESGVKWISIDYLIILFVILFDCEFLQPESDGSRSGSSLSLRHIPPQVGSAGGGGTGTGTGGAAQSPTHRNVHRSASATNPKPSRRASSGGETLRKSNCTRR